MDKSTIGAKVIDRFWNTPIRLARLGRLHSEVIDGVPVFNEEGRGTPANVTFINECFSYVCLHGGLPNVTGQQP